MSKSSKPSNIILFPKVNKHSKTVIEAQKRANAAFVKGQRIEQSVDSIIEGLVNSLYKNGITLEEHAKSAKELAFWIEAVKSLVCSHYKVGYPVQKIAAKLFKTNVGKNTISLISTAAINKMLG